MEAEWHILTVTEGGAVSLLKNLTEEVARKTMQRLRKPFDSGNPWNFTKIDALARQQLRQEAEFARQAMEMQDKGWASVGLSSTGFHHVRDSDLKQVDCFGPEGKTLVVWPKPDDWDERFAAAVARARDALATA